MQTRHPRSFSSFVFLVLSALLFASGSVQASTLAELQQSNRLQSGFIGMLHDADSGKTWLRIENLDEEFIYQSSLPNGLGSNDIGLDRGQLGNTRLVVFERAANKLFLKQKPTAFRAITDNPTEAAAIDEAFASSILWGFEIADSGRSNGRDWVLVDASEFVLQDIHGVARELERQEQGTGYTVDHSRSAIDLARSKAFPDNTELSATITLLGSKPGNFVRDTVPDPYAITLKMQHSFIRLPEPGYQPRHYMPKSGYWALDFMDYAQPINENIKQQVIGRHRLHKQDPALAQSPAIEPIIYYLDPGVPEPVRGALLDGARWWAEAFEALGFKDAYQVQMLPADADPMDVRYNVIQWVHRATRGWSYGSSVVDPRSGEIIKGHVTLGSLRVRQDYLIAQGMLAPFANSADDTALSELALARIRQLSAHEVGHTLGINHNFAASNYGRESVMDYPHPLFELDPADPTKVIAPNAYGVGLGKWDMAAVAWGYAEFADGVDEQVELRNMIADNDRQGLLYISDADARSPGSPHVAASLWDNGKDAIDELQRMIAVRSAALANFGSASLKDGQNWSDLEEIFVPVYYSTRFQVQAAAKWLGGMNYDYAVKLPDNNGEGTAPLLAIADAARQRDALTVLTTTLTPEFLALDAHIRALLVPKPAENYRSRESVNGDTGVAFDELGLAAASAQHTLNWILQPQRLARLHQQHMVNAQVPSITELGEFLHEELIKTSAADSSARALQLTVADLLYSNYLNFAASAQTPPQVKAQIQGILLNEQRYLNKAVRGGDDAGFHSYQLRRISRYLEHGEHDAISLPMMPPGSPI